ncbi:MAG: tRNA pseudouridine(55) synthase TruB [Candidatus Cloacimonetes bacterium]|nr:tRNA pseudouridine(55) synthase TruB [Candidatus Cloacimonadota bacterium]
MIVNDSGFILIDKPAGITSFGVVSALRKITGVKRIGHTGTLDPFATGLLPVCLDKATRLTAHLISSQKTYEVKMRLGEKTDTGDLTGKVIQNKEIIPLKTEQINELVSSVLRLKSQIPPKFSALKIDGKRAYELARKNEDFQLEERPIKIHSFVINNYDENSICYTAEVSKGTYIRVLSETIAELTGNIATTVELRRTSVDSILVSQAVSLDDLNKENWRGFLKPVYDVIRNLSRITVSDDFCTDFCMGRSINYPSLCRDEKNVFVLGENQQCWGLANIEDNCILPKIVLIKNV